MYRAHLIAGASLRTLPSPAFNFGTGDFTVMAMIESLQGGAIVSHVGSTVGAGNPGFVLIVNADSSVTFATYDGVGNFQVTTGATGILDGDCHTVAGIRTGTALTVMIDGVLVSGTSSGNGVSPLNVDNSLALTIGCTPGSQSSNTQFVGDIMNVSLWSVALSGGLLVQAAFARITGTEAGLQGYWSLDASSDDQSPNDNPASIVGPVTFEYCLECVWAEAANAYAFCQITNMPGERPPSTTVSLAREIVVPAGAPAFGMSIMADQPAPAFPVGVTVTLTDPSGTVYDRSQNTDNVFAALSGGQLWGLMVINPAAGIWRVAVTSPATTAFYLNMQTVPNTQVVATSCQALEPLFGGASELAGPRRGLALGGFWSFVAAAAVGVVVGVVVVATGGAAMPAVVAGLVAFTSVSVSVAVATMPVIDSTNLPAATGQIVGMAGFVVAADSFLLVDANVAEDAATTRMYRQRDRKLYPSVTASTFNRVQSKLVGSDMTRMNVSAALGASSSGYVTGCGHGMFTYLMGWYVSGDSGPLEEVISTRGAARFTPAQVTGKIFHLFACRCGDPGTETAPGLGRAMVAAGAVAFIGYKDPVVIDVEQSPAFASCDITIDLAMLNGGTCDTAYLQAIALYNKTITTLRVDGYTQAAARLEGNRDALVAPSTNAMYGNKSGRLKTT